MEASSPIVYLSDNPLPAANTILYVSVSGFCVLTRKWYLLSKQQGKNVSLSEGTIQVITWTGGGKTQKSHSYSRSLKREIIQFASTQE